MMDQGFGKRPYSEIEQSELKDKLATPLLPSDVSERRGFGSTNVSYIEGHRALEIANDIFGPTEWSSELVEMKIVGAHKTPDNKHFIGCYVVMSVQLKNGAKHTDIGFGDGLSRDLAQAYDKAIKQAFTDARKRCLRIFGQGLGLCLYDKNFTEKTKQQKRESAALSTKSVPDNFNLPELDRKTISANTHSTRTATTAYSHEIGSTNLNPTAVISSNQACEPSKVHNSTSTVQEGIPKPTVTTPSRNLPMTCERPSNTSSVVLSSSSVRYRPNNTMNRPCPQAMPTLQAHKVHPARSPNATPAPTSISSQAARSNINDTNTVANVVVSHTNPPNLTKANLTPLPEITAPLKQPTSSETTSSTNILVSNCEPLVAKSVESLMEPLSLKPMNNVKPVPQETKYQMKDNPAEEKGDDDEDIVYTVVSSTGNF